MYTKLIDFDWYLDVYDNVLMGSLLAGNKLSKARKDTSFILEKFGLYSKKDVGVETLSGGQQQRVQVARAIVHDPKIMILDEPIVGMDLTSSIEVLSFLREKAHSEGKTVIISSHQLSLLENYCDSIIFLSKRNMITYSNMNDFKKKYGKFNKYYIEYEGKISEEVLRKIKSKCKIVRNIKPLQIIMIDEFPITTILNILNDDVKITQTKIDDLSLEDVYLFINKEAYNG
ncbi:ABC-2 type transport system ATP-binding protein [Caloranaerobacter azorensis DSM 13643]|uniref:ABC-2 type transport system ATP-binding protein n=1 Tax=Caloranaerobacter azorensis DSM 13643 TaxID=1121264 RepID=A0A1M5QZK5_9FIRM|nr:ABC transporter ATP-binding protein [Caloranaerobacter azorensis]SHH19564.1 ABC-2 type transport system ATP-binding protein [Caloranaerobacter azorensis DSM 13643]